MKNVDAVIFIHRLYFDGKVKKGGPDLIIDHLIANHKTVLLCEYPLDTSQENKIVISRLSGSVRETVFETRKLSRISYLNWAYEIILSLFYGVFCRGGAKLVISTDPLTSLPAVILRKLGFFRFHYYHAVDYSTDRFANKYLNYVYTNLLVLGLTRADLVGMVTRQARERLEQFKVKATIFIPNSPDFHSLDNVRKTLELRDRHSLVVTCSEVLHKYLIHEVIGLLPELKKAFPDINLRIIGHLDRESGYGKQLAQIIKENDLSENVTFYGCVDREENYRIISQSYIGLAFYDGNFSHVIYGDSLKIREYCALGVPVVADAETHTAVEMADRGCGYVTDDVSKAGEYIKRIFSDPVLYQSLSEACLKWAEEFDKKKILTDLFLKMNIP